MTGLPKSYDENSLAVLWDQAFRINNFMVNPVAQCFGQSIENDFKRTTFVMALEIFYIFEDKRRWTVVVQNACQFKEQVSLFFIVEAMLSTKTQLFGNSRDAEGLTRETSAENIEFGNIGYRYLVDVAMGLLAKIRLVCLLAEFVPITGEDAFSTGLFEGYSETSDPAKQVNKPKF